MKYIKICIIIILTLFTTVSNAQDTIKIPIYVAKNIITDLRTGDSARALLPEVSKALDISDSIINEQKKSIQIWGMKEILLKEQLENERKKFSIQSEYIKILEKDNKKLKTKILFNKLFYSTAIIGLGYLYITK